MKTWAKGTWLLLAIFAAIAMISATWRVGGSGVGFANALKDLNVQVVIAGAEFFAADNYSTTAPTRVQNEAEFEEDATFLYYKVNLPNELFGRRFYLTSVETKSVGTATYGSYIETVYLMKAVSTTGTLALVEGVAGISGTDVFQTIPLTTLPLALDDNTLYVLRLTGQGEEGRVQMIVLNGHM